MSNGKRVLNGHTTCIILLLQRTSKYIIVGENRSCVDGIEGKSAAVYGAVFSPSTASKYNMDERGDGWVLCTPYARSGGCVWTKFYAQLNISLSIVKIPTTIRRSPRTIGARLVVHT